MGKRELLKIKRLSLAKARKALAAKRAAAKVSHRKPRSFRVEHHVDVRAMVRERVQRLFQEEIERYIREASA